MDFSGDLACISLGSTVDTRSSRASDEFHIFSTCGELRSNVVAFHSSMEKCAQLMLRVAASQRGSHFESGHYLHEFSMVAVQGFCRILRHFRAPPVVPELSASYPTKIIVFSCAAMKSRGPPPPLGIGTGTASPLPPPLGTYCRLHLPFSGTGRVDRKEAAVPVPGCGAVLFSCHGVERRGDGERGAVSVPGCGAVLFFLAVREEGMEFSSSSGLRVAGGGVREEVSLPGDSAPGLHNQAPSK